MTWNEHEACRTLIAKLANATRHGTHIVESSIIAEEVGNIVEPSNITKDEEETLFIHLMLLR